MALYPKKDYCPEPGNLPCATRYPAMARMATTTGMMALFTTRSDAQLIMFVNMLTAVAGGWAFTCGAGGSGTGVASGVAGEARGSVNRAKTERCPISAVTVPVAASKVVGRTFQVPDFMSKD